MAFFSPFNVEVFFCEFFLICCLMHYRWCFSKEAKSGSVSLRQRMSFMIMSLSIREGFELLAPVIYIGSDGKTFRNNSAYPHSKLKVEAYEASLDLILHHDRVSPRKPIFYCWGSFSRVVIKRVNRKIRSKFMSRDSFK